jgi:uncharacterized protein YjbJ (UPF0337 family)
MAVSKKAEGKAGEVKGKVKKKVGEAAGNEQLIAEGKGDQAKGDAAQAGEKVKDIFKK